jgi:hypothetical protein
MTRIFSFLPSFASSLAEQNGSRDPAAIPALQAAQDRRNERRSYRLVMSFLTVLLGWLISYTSPEITPLILGDLAKKIQRFAHLA